VSHLSIVISGGNNREGECRVVVFFSVLRRLWNIFEPSLKVHQESNISIIIIRRMNIEAIRMLHQSFFENKPNPIHLFVYWRWHSWVVICSS
jgi:hypothetical protein